MKRDDCIESAGTGRRRFLMGAAAGVAAALDAGNPRFVRADTAYLKGGFPEPHFRFPNRIRYDHQCFTIENHDTIIFGGSFHYFRCAKPLWAKRFAQIRDAGFNSVETYIAWDLHERKMPRGLDDFSGVNLTDVDEWLTMAAAHGLHIIVRPGPYICAEYNTGGFPRWLLTKTPANFSSPWLRSDDPLFIEWSLHWYRAVCPLLARHQITNKKPGEKGIILIQLENEYNYSGLPASQGRHYIAALARSAVEQGINVPLITNDSNCVIGAREPALRQICDGQDWYPGKNVTSITGDVVALRKSQVNAPVFTPELQGGWFDAVVWAPSLRTNSDNYAGLGPRQVNNLTLYCLQQGVKMMNYYMLFGGTNFGNHAARSIATSYDYSAPIRECGGIGSKYQAVAAIGAFLGRHGSALARSVAVPCDANMAHAAVEAAVRLAANGDLYVFVRTSQEHRGFKGRAVIKLSAPRRRTISFDYQLDPFGSKVLHIPAKGRGAAPGRWLVQPALTIVRPPANKLPRPVTLDRALFCADTGPVNFTPMRAGQTMEEAGLYDNLLVYYRSSVQMGSPAGGPMFLAAQFAGSGTGSALINGKAAPQVKARRSGEIAFEAGPLLRSGHNDIEVLYASDGNPNTHTSIAELSGLTDLVLTPRLSGEKALGHWKMRLLRPAAGAAQAALPPDINGGVWRGVHVNQKGDANQLKPDQRAIFCHDLVRSEEDLTHTTTRLSFTHIDNDGWVFVNDRLVGATDDWNRAWSFDITSALHAGRNRIAVIVQNHAGGGGIAGPKLHWSAGGAGTVRGSLELSAEPKGIVDRWMAPELDDGHWQEQTLGTGHKQVGGLLHWYRLKFQMPASPENVWVPWCLRIYAEGSGYIYLNGYNLVE